MNRAQRLVFLLYKQGALSGRLNRVQQLALTGALAAANQRLNEDNLELIKAVIIAGNVELYRVLFPETEDIDEDTVSWIQPGTPEYDELMAELQADRAGQDSIGLPTSL